MKNFVVPSIFTAIDKFSGPVQKMSRNAEASMSRMERKFRNVGTGAFDVSRKTAALGLSIAVPMGILANEAIKFEEKMSNVSTLIDTQAESIEDMGDKVLSLSKRLPVPIEELTAALYDIRSAGIPANKAMETLEFSAKLSAAGLSTVEEATNISTSAINAFKSENLSAAKISDILFKTVKFGKTTISELSQAFGSTAPIIQSAGVSLADFQAATAALTTLGTPAAQAQNQIRSAIISLQKPTSEMEKVFKHLGVTTDKELIKKFGGLGKGFQAVTGAIEEMGLNTAKTFGKTEALAAVMSLTGATNEAYTTTLNEMVNGTDALNGAFDKQAKTGKAAMQIAKNNIQSLSITLGTTLIPMITSFVEAVSPMLKSFGVWAKENKGTISTIMKVTAVVGALSFAISAGSFAVGLATKTFGIYKFAIQSWSSIVKVAQMAQMAWNAAMLANPIGLMIGVIAAAGVAVYALSRAFSSQTDAQRLANKVTERAKENTIDQRIEVTMLFKALRRAKVGSEEYGSTLRKIERLQPGITKQYNLQAGAIDNINRAEKDLMSTIIKRAEVQARAEMLQEKVRERLQLEASVKSTEGQSGFSEFFQGFGDYENTHSQLVERLAKAKNEEKLLTAQVVEDQVAKETVNPRKTEQNSMNSFIEKKTSENVTVDFKNMPSWVDVAGGQGMNFSMPSLGNTR